MHNEIHQRAHWNSEKILSIKFIFNYLTLTWGKHKRVADFKCSISLSISQLVQLIADIERTDQSTTEQDTSAG